MRVTILGAGTCIPHPDRASPGLVLQSGADSILLDPSSGSLHRMEKAGISFRSIRAVAFSHYHPDHTGDLLPLMFAFYVDPDNEQRLKLLGPPGLRRFCQGLVGLYGEWVGRMYSRLDIEEIEDYQGELHGLKARTMEVEHSQQALGYRWETARGGVFAYSGDTEYCRPLVDLSRGADVAVMECSYPNGMEAPGHLTPATVGKAAALAEVKRLILSHRYPQCDGEDLIGGVRGAGFTGKVELARDGMAFQV